MIKVAFFADILIPEFDGASRTMFQLIDRIDKNRFAYMFIYGKGPRKFRHYPSYSLQTFPLVVNQGYSLALPTFIKKDLYATLDAYQPDVIHISSPSPLGFFALKYARKRNIPVLSIFHTSPRMTNPISYLRVAWFGRKICKH